VLATVDREIHQTETFLREIALPLQEALMALGIDKSTFYRYCEAGKLSWTKHRGRTWVPHEVIEQYQQELLAEAQRKKARALRHSKRRK
jgi:predicted site-specific integrase-resolvase